MVNPITMAGVEVAISVAYQEARLTPIAVTLMSTGAVAGEEKIVAATKEESFRVSPTTTGAVDVGVAIEVAKTRAKAMTKAPTMVLTPTTLCRQSELVEIAA
jgi:hypothetical protein